MPCRSEDSDNRIYNEHHKFMAILCGLTTVLETEAYLDKVLDVMNWKEVGVPRVEFETWWIEHKRRDELRRKRDEDDRQKQELMRTAFAKMTPEERRVFQGL